MASGMWSPDALAAYLGSIEDAEVVMRFSQIDSRVGQLPASAYKHNV